jgi:hypothetical protein
MQLGLFYFGADDRFWVSGGVGMAELRGCPSVYVLGLARGITKPDGSQRVKNSYHMLQCE